VIAPEIRIVDVEPDGFGIVCDLASRHDHSSRGQLHVLHEGGQVLRVVHTVHGPTMQHREPLGSDLPATARALRESAGVDRVVLVERSGLLAMADDLAATGPATIDQPTFFRRSNALFWASPAVVTDPAAPATGPAWERLEEHLRGLGDDYWGLLAGYDGEVCAFTLLARFVGGRIVHLTSMIPLLGTERPPADRAEELVSAAEQLGPVPLVLVASLDVLRDIAADLPTTLSACAPQARISRGLPA
jgi:hypothetical protein